MVIRALIVLMTLCALGAAEGTDAPPPPVVADFSDGLGQLAALARYDLDSTAVWVRVPSRESRDGLSKVTVRLKGNAWSISAGDAPRVLTMGAPAAEEVQAPGRPREPAPAELAADVATLIKNIATLRPKADDDYNLRWMRDGGESYGSLLLFAAQLHQAGHPAEANQLAAALFQAAPSRQSVVDSAIELLGDHEFSLISNEFFTHYDWVAYHRALSALHERFPRGWTTRRAVAIFLPQLGKQAEGAPPPPVALAGVTPDPRALAAIAELSQRPTAATPSPAMRGGSSGNPIPSGPWVLQRPDSVGLPDTPIGRLAALGMDAVPTLAALAEDPYLVPMPNPGSDHYRYYYFSSRESTAERALRIYRSMQRPATRGELAVQLLSGIIPDPDSELDEADAATIRELAIDFWKQHQHANRDELALVYAIGGSSMQRSHAVNVVAASSDPEIVEKLEQSVLAAHSALEQLELAQAYVRLRKTAAKPFAAAYAKRLKEEVAAMDPDDLPWQLRQRGSLEGILKSLGAQAEGKSPRAIARDIARGDPDEAEEAMEALRPLLVELDPRPRLHALLEGAFAAKDAGVREMFLEETFEIDWESDEEEEEDGDDAPRERPERPVSEAEEAVWKTLIADNRKNPDEGWESQGITTISQLAALAMENSILPGFHFRAYHASGITKQSPAEIAVARATARHSGKPVPALPNPRNIDADRLAAIITEAGTKPPDGIVAYLDGLSHDERAAWAEWFNGADDPPLPDSVRQAATLIIKRGMADGGRGYLTDVPGAAGIDPGFTLTRASLAERIGALAGDAAAQSRTSVWITPADFQPGLQVFAARPAIPEAAAGDDEETDDEEEYDDRLSPADILVFAIRSFRNAPDNADAAVHVGFFTHGGRAEAVWFQQDGKTEAADPDDAEKLLDAVQAAFAGGRGVVFRLQLQVITRADAEALTPN